MNEDSGMNTGLVLTKEGIGDILRMVHEVVCNASKIYDLKLGITTSVKEINDVHSIQKRQGNRKVISLYIDLE